MAYFVPTDMSSDIRYQQLYLYPYHAVTMSKIRQKTTHKYPNEFHVYRCVCRYMQEVEIGGEQKDPQYRNHNCMSNLSFKVLSCDLSCNGKYAYNANRHGQYLVINVTALNATEVVLIGYPNCLFWLFSICVWTMQCRWFTYFRILNSRKMREEYISPC